MRWTEDKIKEYVESRNLILVGITCLNGKNSIIIVKCKNNHKHFEIKLANLLRRKEEVICNDCKEDIIRNELKIYIESEDYIFIDTFIEKTFDFDSGGNYAMIIYNNFTGTVEMTSEYAK